MKFYRFIYIIIIMLINTPCFAGSDYEKYVEDLSSSNLQVKKKAVIMLGNTGRSEAVPILTDLLKNDGDISIRRICADSLGKLGIVIEEEKKEEKITKQKKKK